VLARFVRNRPKAVILAMVLNYQAFNMRFITIMLLTCYVTAQASPLGWVRIAGFSNVVAEMDEGSLVHKAELIEATFRFSYPESQRSRFSAELYRSAEVTALFSCKDQTFVPFQRREFSELQSKGRLIAKSKLPADQLKLAPVIAGSMNEAMYERACSVKKQ
jgi:hypothetical protein